MSDTFTVGVLKGADDRRVNGSKKHSPKNLHKWGNFDELRKGARTFSDFKKDSNAVGESWETLFQSYLKLTQDAAVGESWETSFQSYLKLTQDADKREMDLD